MYCSFRDLNPTSRYDTAHLQRVDKTTETLRNCITEFVCVGYIEITSTDNNKCSCLFTLCSASVSAFVIVLSDSPCQRSRKWDSSECERGQIIGASLAAASVSKTATLLAVLRAAVSKAVTIHESWKDNINKEVLTNSVALVHERTIPTEHRLSSGQKSTRTERNCQKARALSKNHRPTAAQVPAELNILES
jgi:hypothetical protein